MKMEEIEKIPSFGLIKFTPNSERAKQVMDGKFYMNMLQFFIDLEKEALVRGQGDRLEGTLVINDAHMRVSETGTGKEAYSGHVRRVNFVDEFTANLNVFCFYNLDATSCVFEKHNDKVFLKSTLSQSEIEKLSKTFGDYLVFIDVYRLIERIEGVLQERKITGALGRVSYYDLDKNEIGRFRDSFGREHKRPFIKDIFFKSQNEYRVVADIPQAQRNEDGSAIFDIGSIEEFSTLCTTKQFFSEDTQLEITNKGLIVNLASQ